MSQNTNPQSVMDSAEAAPSLDSSTFAAGYTYDDPGTGFSMEASADRLMDEVFNDVERLLERGVQLQPADVPAPAAAVAPTAPIDLPLPPPVEATAENTGRITPRQLALQETDLEDLADLSEPIVETTADTDPRSQNSRSFDPLLLFAIGASLVATATFWFVFRPKPQPVPPSAPTSPASKASKPDDFLSYVGKALDKLERQSKSQASPSPNAPASPTVIERVYVYPSPGAATPGGQPVPPAPTLLPSPIVMAPAARPAPSAASSPSAGSASASSQAVVPNIAPSPIHKLIGLLELGDRSAALFEINGTPQRIQVGEAVGSSGWTLVSVSNQEAVIRRNGEVRSVYIGQQF